MARRHEFPWLAVAGAAGAAAAIGLLLAARHNAEAAALDAETGFDLTGGDATNAFGAGSTDMANADDASKTATYTPGSTTINLATGGGLTGSVFGSQIMNQLDYPREHAIDLAVAGGNVPAALADLVPVQTSANGHTGTFFVTPDYVGVGTDSDWLRTPMYPATAQRIADRAQAVLLTRHMVDLVYQQAPVKLPFHSFTPGSGPANDSTQRYIEHNRLVEADRQGRSGLAAGHHKDIVIGTLLARYPRNLQIYGAWRADGTRVQPPSGTAHSLGFVDYSHGVRLAAPTMLVDGNPMAVADVLRSQDLSPLLSDEGVIPLAGLRYPTAY